MLTEQSIEAILSDWHDWQESGLCLDSQPSLRKMFSDGSNHDVALLSGSYRGKQSEHVLKCFSTAHPSAIEAQKWACKLGLAPAVEYADPDFTYCLMPYLNEDSISPESATTSDLRAIATALNVLHNASIPETATSVGMFDLPEFCNQHLKTCGTRARDIHQKMIAPINDFMSDTTPMSFCHNDLVPGNCFVIDEQVQFIDWEYAQLHNPWFDLAAIIYYLQLSDKQAATFLDDYEAGWSVFVGTSIFYTSQLCLLWGDMLWHLAKFGLEFWPKLEVKLNDLEQFLKIRQSIL